VVLNLFLHCMYYLHEVKKKKNNNFNEEAKSSSNRIILIFLFLYFSIFGPTFHKLF